MFLKLCKYELKRSYKIISLFYIILLCSSTTMFESPYGIQLLVMFIAGLLVATLGVLIGIGVNFYQTMYGREAYLTNTLPASSTELILSKFTIAVFWVLMSMLICVISCYFAIEDVCVISFTDYFNMKLMKLMGVNFLLYLAEIALIFGILSFCHTSVETKHRKIWVILYSVSFTNILYSIFSKDEIFTNVLMNTAFQNEGKNFLFNYQTHTTGMEVFIILLLIATFLIITKLCIDRIMEI